MGGIAGIVLSEISETKKDKYCIKSLMCGILKKKLNSQKQRVKWQLPGTEEWEKGGDLGQRAHTCSYKLNKSWGYNVQHNDYS